MLIYICDGKAADRKRIRCGLNRFADERAVRPVIFEFSNEEQLLAAAEQSQPDLVFLDVSGIDCEQLKALSELIVGKLVLYSVSDKFALQAFKLGAVGYLLKPVLKEDFDNLMKHIAARFEMEQCSIEIPIGRKALRLPLSGLYCVETKNHHTHFILATGEYVTTKPLITFAEPLSQFENLMFIGKSFVVNLCYVKSAADGMLLLENGTKIPVPVRLKATVQRYISRYCASRGI